MANLSWGKPTIKFVDDKGATIDIKNIVEGSTQLIPTKGTRREAPLEGGGFADLAYNKNTYVFEFEIYAVKGESKPVVDVDGVVEKHYSVKLQPEDPTVEGIVIEEAAISVEETYSAEIGKKWKYTCDVITPETGASVKHEVVTFT
jgi:hypothetical protein